MRETTRHRHVRLTCYDMRASDACQSQSAPISRMHGATSMAPCRHNSQTLVTGTTRVPSLRPTSDNKQVNILTRIAQD